MLVCTKTTAAFQARTKLRPHCQCTPSTLSATNHPFLLLNLQRYSNGLNRRRPIRRSESYFSSLEDQKFGFYHPRSILRNVKFEADSQRKIEELIESKRYQDALLAYEEYYNSRYKPQAYKFVRGKLCGRKRRDNMLIFFVSACGLIASALIFKRMYFNYRLLFDNSQEQKTNPSNMSDINREEILRSRRNAQAFAELFVSPVCVVSIIALIIMARLSFRWTRILRHLEDLFE